MVGESEKLILPFENWLLKIENIQDIFKCMAVRSLLSSFNISKIIVPVLVVFLVASAFLIGVLWTKISYLEKGVSSGIGGGSGVQPPAVPSRQVTVSQIKDLFSKDVIKFGSADRKLLFVEVADTSCPFCHVAAGENPELNRQVGGGKFKLVSDGGSYLAPVPEMKKLVDQGKASFVYLYSPGHGNGEMGAKALYCAYAKGKFWGVHDLLMTNKAYDLLNNVVQNDKSKSGELAEFLKPAINSGDLKACLDSGKYDSWLNNDVGLATSLGVGGTPGFFVNETPYAGAYGWKDMESVVNSALGK